MVNPDWDSKDKGFGSKKKVKNRERDQSWKWINLMIEASSSHIGIENMSWEGKISKRNPFLEVLYVGHTHILQCFFLLNVGNRDNNDFISIIINIFQPHHFLPFHLPLLYFHQPFFSIAIPRCPSPIVAGFIWSNKIIFKIRVSDECESDDLSF